MQLNEANGDAQLALLQKLLAPLPFFMELSAFGEAYRRAHDAFMAYAPNSAESARWYDCLVAIRQIALVRFGGREWVQYEKRLRLHREPAPQMKGEDYGLA